MKEGGRLRNAVRQRTLSRVGRAIGVDVGGQATVEAAYLIPVVFLCLLLLVQPGIILYDFTVMRSAAAEGCRLLATKTDAAGSSDEACIAYVKRRLSAVPPQDQFHIHDGACSWVIDVEGDESSEYVQVTITNKVKLLPLVDTGATLLGMTDASGEYSIEASSRMPTQPSWVGSSKSGRDPRAWVGGRSLMAVVLDALKNMVARSMRMAIRRAPRPIPGESLSRHRRRSVFYAEEGFSTVGMVFALLITLSLIFTTAQVYEIETTSSHVQNVADAAALAAENEVAEFSIVVRLCDALVLTMSLTGIATMGLGIAALCTPATAPLADKLIKAATDVIDARNTFARRAASGLNRFQAFLPFLAAANAASIVQANSDVSAGTEYFGFAVVLPIEGDAIEVGSLDSAKELANNVEENEARIKEAAEAAEEASGEAKAEKEKAFMADCGNDPGYCMYERAGHLAGLSAKDNPLYRSVDTWSFSVALKRAQAYYPARLAQEAPEGASVEEQARSALRTRYYRFAVEEIGKGYVREDEDSFEARFPLLPKNTEQMRRTDLFTEAVYPVTIDSEGGAVMHAWAGCPGVSGGQAAGAGSLAQMEAGRFVTCSACGFTAASLGKVASASTSIDNGFEYHYNIVAEAADAYQKAREKARPYAEEVKTLTKDLLDDVDGALFDAMSYRIESQPPGRYGAVAFAADLADISAATRFPSAFVKGNASVGARAAVSAAALASDDPSEGETVITALLDNVEADVAGGAAMPLGIVLDLWSALLACYASGMESLERGIENALSQMPLASESGLGTWAANAFSDAVGSLGLSPAELDSPKPVLVNTAHVLASDASGFSSALLKAKEDCVALGDAAGADLFTTALSVFESSSLEALDGFEQGIEIAVIEPFGEAGPSIPLTLALPPAVTSIAGRAVQGSIDKMRAVYAQAGGVRRWE